MKPTKAGKIGRREVMQVACKIGLASAGAILLGGCKGSTTPDTEPPLPSVPASVLVKFYNHTQGYLGEKIYNGMSETPLSIKVSDCPDLRTVDANLLAIREGIKNGWLGKYLEFSKTGQSTATKFPRQDAEYSSFLMNTTNGANYALLESGAYYLGLLHSPNATWDREDTDATGPDEIPHEAMRQIKESLVFPWAKYMDFAELQPYVRGNFFVGYLMRPTWYPYGGGFSEGSAWVDPTVFTDDILRLRVFIESIFGHLTMSYTPGQPPTVGHDYITSNSGINQVGKDLLAYSLVRDKRSVT